MTEATSAYQGGGQRWSAVECSRQSYFDAPQEWPPVDFMQGAIVDVRGQTVSPMLLIVCNKMFGAGHLNQNEHPIYTSFWKARTTPVL